MFSPEVVSPYALWMGFEATNTDTDDDAALARRISGRERDAAAEAAICRRFGPRIRLYGLKHLRSEAAAADLVQDVLVMVLTKLRDGAVREPERLASFVLGMARQTVIDQQRGGRRRARILEAFPLDLTPAAEEAPEPIDSERLKLCLGALPERERSVLLMTFYDDRPADAVAAELKLTAGNVRVIRHRGLDRLRDCMTQAEGTT